MLVNLPLRNQLQEPTSDGRPDENAQANCAAASLASIVTAATGQAVYGDQLKDAVYGEGYTGATDPDRYHDYVQATYGLTIGEYRSVYGNALVTEIIRNLHAGVPVLGAIPSQWGVQDAAYIRANPNAGTHEVAFCDDDGTNLTAMNPWPAVNNNAFYQTMPYAYWASHLVYSRVNPVVRASGAAAVSYNVGPGIAAFLAANPEYGHATSDELYVGTIGYITTSTGALVYWDKTAQAAKTDGATVLVQVVGDLHAQLATLTQQVTDAKAAQVAAQAAQASDAKQFSAQIAFLKAQVASLGQDKAEQAAQISDLKTQLAAIQSYPRGPVTGNINADAIGTRMPAAVALASGGSLFAKARANLSLTPMQRTLLRVVGHSAFSALIASAWTAMQFGALRHVDWNSVALVAGGSLALTVLAGLDKYYKSHGDAPVGAVLDAIMGLITARIPQAQVAPDAPPADAALPLPEAA